MRIYRNCLISRVDIHNQEAIAVSLAEAASRLTSSVGAKGTVVIHRVGISIGLTIEINPSFIYVIDPGSQQVVYQQVPDK
ncbi:hypothetical protein BABINDRAFT_162725 [Babjeviella inositovora NRRL Y-12698]|uniref:Uncharacterized protein n=1 Tax=Babjeviella inositovora NRRL Y-12698 TaxID=984486 RepID=A0A1E3QLI9_9ASCO|nr:uncharacterized protein BABINDRAFT_162725 [Babjeviella inositovora NRRL Y-12698]ODQ78520.1 hypothetical protein BABINDRAFT_162725 [Babjeviella inositovora NRRL Y-12698]